MKLKQTGTVFVHAGRWYYAVKLPGEDKRRQVPLKAPGSTHALAADRPRTMAEQAAARYWEEHTRQIRKGDAKVVTVDDLCTAWGQHAETYYRTADGKPTSEVAQVIIGVRLFREMFARAAVSELTHADMMRWRDAAERSGVARTTVNKRVGILKRMMAWALDAGMISAATKCELSQVQPLKRGRCLAHETTPVRPVDDATIEKTLPAMMPNTADMVRVHRLTGMRPEEMCALRWADIDTTRRPWVYRPRDHKNKWRGMPRVVLIGPRARTILERHRDAETPFSPMTAMSEWFAAKREAAVSPSRVSRRDPHCPRKLGTAWATGSYTKTIEAACARVGVPAWGANRLRHAFATDVRRGFGLDACRAVLGHSAGGGCVTDRYSFDALEDEMIRTASPAVEALG